MVFSTKSLLTTLLQSSAVLAATINVNVGGNTQLIFSPTTVNANPGDTVQFTFLDQNHTVTAGNPNQGCKPSGQFNSGFVPVAANANTKPTFSVKVPSTQPITVYCAQAQHCQVGMVMVINPTANGATSLAAYTKLCAKAATNTPAKGVNGGVLKNANTAAATTATTATTGKGRKKGAAAVGATGAGAAGAGATGAGAAAAKKKTGLAALFGRQVGPSPAAAPSAPCPPPPCLNGTVAATNGTTPATKKGKGKKAGKKANKAAKKAGKKGKKGKCAQTTLATVASLSVPSVSAIPLPSAVSAASAPSLV